jgi:nitroreductase
VPGREQTGVDLGEDPPLWDVLRTTRAMRRLAPDAVPIELLDRLVEAATWGPSGSNAQAYQFVVVTDREQMRRLAPLYRRCIFTYLATIGGVRPRAMDEGAFGRLRAAVAHLAEHFEDIPALIVPCYAYPREQQRVSPRALLEGMRILGGPGDLARVAAKREKITLLTEASSIYPGVQNMLLAARALGLAATLTTIHVMLEAEFKVVLGIPKRINTYALIPVGWPLGRFGPVTRRPVAEVVHRDRW